MIRKDVLLRGVIFVLFLLLFYNWVQFYIGNCFYFLSSSKRVLLATCPFLSRIWTLVFVLVLLLWSPFQDLSLMWGPGSGGLVVSQMSWRPRDLVGFDLLDALEEILSSKSETRCLLHPTHPRTTHTWYLSFFPLTHFEAWKFYTQKYVNLWQKSPLLVFQLRDHQRTCF